MRLPRVLGDLGYDPAAVLEGTGIAPAFFADPDMPVLYGAALRLLAHCAQRTGCAHLGLRLGEGTGAEVLGLPGMLVLSAPDVGAALRGLVQYLDLHDRGAVVALEVEDDGCWLGYDIVVEGEGAEVAHDLALTVARNLMCGFCGEGWAPSEVWLPRRRPADAAPWLHGFRAPVRFDAPRCALRFPRHWLERRLPAGNPALHAYLQKEAARLQSAIGRSLVDEVRRIVQGMLAHGPASAARVAGLMGVHERTLHRRLRAHDTSYSAVRDEVLYRVSRQMLGTSSMRVAEVATALGYAEASAFIHAFARWSGQTPQQWRRRRAAA